MIITHTLFFLFFNVYYIFLRERERERQSMSRGRQRERETQNLKQAPGSELRAVDTEPDAGLKLTNNEITT